MKSYIIRKYQIISIILICLLLSSCFLMPCQITLLIENISSEARIILIDYNKNIKENIIGNNEKILFKNKIMKNIKYVYIKTENIEGIFSLSEYDHWFASTHKLKIVIGNENFEIDTNGLKLNGELNYEWENEENIYRWDENSKKVLEEKINPETIFEIIKEERFKEIYEIIKK